MRIACRLRAHKYQYQQITPPMQPNKIDSVHGYLTPKRMLSSLMKPSTSKSKINRSMTSDDINSQPVVTQSQGQRIGTTSRRQTESYKKKQGGHDPFNAIQTSSDPMNKWGDSDKVDAIKMYTDQNGASSRISKASKNSGISDNQLPLNSNIDKFGPMNKKAEEPSYLPSNRKFVNPNKNNPDIYRLSIQQTMNKLSKIKDYLESQINGLKKLLDETSANLENMDSEYEQFKEKILFFVSKALDSAFKEYKKNLPNWAIYESVEEKGLNKIAEINQAIQVCQSEEMLKQFGGKQEMQKIVEQSKITASEVKDARAECLAQRPMISEEKMKKLEHLLKQIGQF